MMKDKIKIIQCTVRHKIRYSIKYNVVFIKASVFLIVLKKFFFVSGNFVLVHSKDLDS